MTAAFDREPEGTSVRHTPGPWEQYAPRIDDVVDPHYRTIVAGELGGFRGEGGFNLTGFVSETDARLIAAAPELLRELKVMVELADSVLDSWATKSAKAAIAKAEGAES